MGYNTKFEGVLKFNQEIPNTVISKINRMLGQNCREHPEWADSSGLKVIDLKFTDDFSGLTYSGHENSGLNERMVNVVILEIRKHLPSFSFTGSMRAQGEEPDDRWVIIINLKTGLAEKSEIKVVENPLDVTMYLQEISDLLDGYKEDDGPRDLYDRCEATKKYTDNVIKSLK